MGPHGQNNFGAVSTGNITTGCQVVREDNARVGPEPPPVAAGSYTWSIPTQWIDTSGARHTFGNNQNHVGTFAADGSATIAKGGQTGGPVALNAASAPY